MALNTTRWNSAEYLQTDEDIADYLDTVLEEIDPALITHALSVIARARSLIKSRMNLDWAAKRHAKRFPQKANRTL